jgi:RNA polymerase sigma factor (sigma-70 family)
MSATEAQLEELMRDHARLVAAAARRVCRRRYRSLVPDVEQEVYLALWRQLGTGKKIEHPVSYLYKMALTTALRLIRKLERQPVGVEDEELLAVLDTRAANPSSLALEPVERTRLLKELLESLEPDDARALRAYLAGFGHREVAALYGWTESVARHRIYRTLDRLRRQALCEPGAEAAEEATQ